MKKAHFLSFIAVAIMFAFACNQAEKPKQDIQSEKIDPGEVILIAVDGTAKVDSGEQKVRTLLPHYTNECDSIINEAKKTYKNKFNKAKAKIYFVKNWNTPDEYACTGMFTGATWDGNAFWGYEEGDYVYYTGEHQAYGDTKNVVPIERRFPKDGVTQDPRKTCWWLSTIQDPYNNIDKFLADATLINSQNKDEKTMTPFLRKIKADILQCSGATEKDKVINYTGKAVAGSYNTWDASKWPGYYKSIEVDEIRQN